MVYITVLWPKGIAHHGDGQVCILSGPDRPVAATTTGLSQKKKILIPLLLSSPCKEELKTASGTKLRYM